MATLRESQILPQVSRVLCIWLPKESHRYSRRFPAFYVLPIVGQWSTGSPSPSICRTAPTCLPVLIQTWITVSLAVLLISVSQGTTASLRCISTDNSREFPRSLDFCVSSVYFERNFLVFLGALHFSISRSLSLGLLIPRYLDLQGTSSVFVSAPLLANRTNWDHHLPRVFWTLTLPVSVYIERTPLGKLSPKISRPVSLPHDRSLGLSPINITRLGSGRIAVDGREGPSLLYPRYAAPARPRERLSLGSARNTGSFDFTRTGNPATLTDRVTMCRTVKRHFHVYSKAPHGSAYSSLTTQYF